MPNARSRHMTVTNGDKIYVLGGFTPKGTTPRVDVWGISDLHLFEEANQVLRKQEKPFFLAVGLFQPHLSTSW